MLVALFLVLFLCYLSVMGIVLLRLHRAFKAYRIRRHFTAALEPPSVSVCVPARNEMHALAACLERVLASKYPKLEVIVYDDESIDETSFIVRSFAQAGVRFIAAQPLPKGWIGKNYALEVLAREASGTFIVFMDVDTIIEPSTLHTLVGCMTSEKATMLSVIPRRLDSRHASAWVATLRYFWQLLELAKKHAPASSSLWMIHRQQFLDRFDGFKKYKTEVMPESRFAYQLGSAYRCLVSSDEIGVSFEKKWRSQLETSRRLLYPYFGGHWYGVIVGGSILLFLNSPLALMLLGASLGWGEGMITALVLTAPGICVFAYYLYCMQQRFWWLHALMWPVVILQEQVLFIASVSGYLRQSITWKDRKIS